MKKYQSITFYFVEECPGCGLEDIKKEFKSAVLIFSLFLSF
jgi:hypothetical protein